MNKILVRFKKLDERAIAPTYGSDCAAGADLYALADKEITIGAGETAFVHTGIAAEIPENLVGLVYARSGLACKKGLAPANKVGVIDSDYRGEIMVALYNQSNEPRTIADGERIAQLVIAPYLRAEFTECETLSDTARGEGGFGSTGKFGKRLEISIISVIMVSIKIQKEILFMAKYVCSICGYEYDEATGDPDNGLAPGTKWEDVPEDFTCPLCGVGKDMFESEEA